MRKHRKWVAKHQLTQQTTYRQSIVLDAENGLIIFLLLFLLFALFFVFSLSFSSFAIVFLSIVHFLESSYTRLCVLYNHLVIIFREDSSIESS